MRLNARLALVLVCAALVSCSSEAGDATASPTTAAINCGQATAVVTDPTDVSLHGVPIGPIFFPSSRDPSGRAVIPGFKPGDPTKVLIQPMKPLTAAVRLEGWRCITGERLRLEYGTGTATVAAALLPAGSAPNGAPVGYTGYMLFTAAGEWLIAVSTKDGHLLGRAVFTIQQATAG